MEVKPGYKQTEVGVIPEDWELRPLVDMAEIRSGIAKNSNVSVSDPVLVHYLRVANVQDGFLDLSEVSRIRVGRNDIKRYAVQPGDMLMNEGGDLDKLGRGSIWRGEFSPCIHQNHVFVVRCRLALSPEYLSAWTGGAPARRYFMLAGKQTTNLASINKTALGQLPVAVPAPGEQIAIAEVLSDGDALIDSLEQLVAKKRRLKQGAMQEILTGKKRLPNFNNILGYKQTELGVIPEDWGVISAFDACSKIQDGTHFSPRSRGNDYLYVTSKNVRLGHLDLSTAGRIDAAQHHAIYRRCDVRQGDLLLTKDGANTGNAALNTLAEEFSLLSSVAFLRFNPSKHCAAYFLHQILTPQGQRQIQDAMAGNAITRLTLEKINKLRFPVPPTRAEQEAIAAILSDMDAEIAAHEAKLVKARQLKQGLMQELLTGRIRLV
jgi:type I restriction enzyme, S subunit